MLRIEPKHRVAILIPTKDRPEFVLRQLRYYASVASPHPVYVGDSSDRSKFLLLDEEVRQLSKSLEIHHIECPQSNERQFIRDILRQIDLPYAVYSGDDDYQIPNSLTQAAVFLESNPDYSTARGSAIAFELMNPGAFGKLKRIKPYVQPEVLEDTAAARLIKYFSNYYVTEFSVNRRDRMREYYDTVDAIPDKTFSAELLNCALAIVDGKSKLLDRLGFVRQIHNIRHKLPSAFDWISQPDWPASYQTYESIVSKALTKKDGLVEKESKKRVKQSLWLYLNKYMESTYKNTYPSDSAMPDGWKNQLGRYKLIRKIYGLRKKLTKPLHQEMLNPNSIYFSDFLPIKESFSQLS